MTNINTEKHNLEPQISDLQEKRGKKVGSRLIVPTLGSGVLIISGGLASLASGLAFPVIASLVLSGLVFAVNSLSKDKNEII